MARDTPRQCKVGARVYLHGQLHAALKELVPGHLALQCTDRIELKRCTCMIATAAIDAKVKKKSLTFPLDLFFANKISTSAYTRMRITSVATTSDTSR